MIIECKTCHARFRLDESKIKGRGARVKCRKCGEQIVVLKEADAGPADPGRGGEGSLDLGSAIRETAGERPSAFREPPPDNLIQFPKSSARAAEPPAAAGKDEVDLAFEQLLQRSSEMPEEPAPVAEPPSGPTFEPPAELSFEPPAEQPFEPPAGLTFETQAEASAQVSDAVEETPVPETPEWGIEPNAVEIAPEERHGLPSLKDEDRPPAIGQTADISMAIASSPTNLEPDLLLETSAYLSPKEEGRAPESEGIVVEGNVTPPPSAREADVPSGHAEEPAEPDVEPVAAPAPREPAEMPPTKRSGPSFGLAAGIALVLALLAAVGYFGFTGPGKRFVGSVLPGIPALLGGKDAGQAISRYEVKNVMGYYDNGAASPRILVIKGQVTNLSSTGKSGIRILASLLDNTGKIMMEETVYAGNVLSGARMKTESREALKKTLVNPLGEHLMNMDVPSGKSIPFMVLFFDAPEDIDSYKLEARDTQ